MKLALALLLLASCAALAATEEQIQKSFQAAPGGSLVVEVNYGSIDVATGATEEVTVDAWRRITRRNKADEEQYLRENPIQFLREGDTITVRCREKATQKRRWFSWVFRQDRNEAKYTIRVPARFNATLNTSGDAITVSDLTGDVKARTSGGPLRFNNLHGPLDGRTSGGGIRVSDCEGAIQLRTSGGRIEVADGGGSLDGHTSGGGITVKTFGGPVSVGTSGGGITVENVKGSIKARTSGGSVNASLLLPVPGDVTLSTSGGGVTVKAPEGAAFDLDAKTSGGGVSTDFPVTIQGSIQRSALKGAVNGGGPEVQLRTSGGGIHVKKL